MATQKFDSADRAVIAKMDAIMLRELTRADREDRKLFAQFSRAMDQAITARQRELAAERARALKEITAIMSKHNLTVKEVFA